MPWRGAWVNSKFMEILKWCNPAWQPCNVSFCHSFFVALKITSLFKSFIFSLLCSLCSTCCPSSNICLPVGLRVLSLLENATVLSGWRRQDRLCVRSQVRGHVEKVRQWFLSLLLDHAQRYSWYGLCMQRSTCIASSFSILNRKARL